MSSVMGERVHLFWRNLEVKIAGEFKIAFLKRFIGYVICNIKKTLIPWFQVVLQDEKLAHSEAVYAFFSPSPEHLKQAPSVPKRAKFSMANLFKG